MVFLHRARPANSTLRSPADFLAYDRGGVALYFLLNGIMFGINAETNPNFPDLFFNNDMYGQRILKGSPEELRGIGLTDGNAHKVALIRNQYYVATTCTCVTQAWTTNGPVSTCVRSLCDEKQGGNSSRPFCKDTDNILTYLLSSPEAFAPVENLGVRCGTPYITYSNAIAIMSVADPTQWTTGDVAAMFTLFSSSWLSIDTTASPNVGEVAYWNNLNGNRFMSMTNEELQRIGFSEVNAKNVVDGREEHYGHACTCVQEAWYGGLGPGLRGNGPRPPLKCLAYLRIECLKNSSLPFCDTSTFDTSIEPPYEPRDPDFSPEFLPLVFDTLLGLAKTCKVDYVTRENFELISSTTQVTEYSSGDVALLVLFFGDMYMGIHAETNSHSATTFYEQDINGDRFMLLDVLSLTSLGFTDGSASAFVRGRNAYYGYFSWPPSDTYNDMATTGQERAVNEQFDVSVTFVLDKLMGLDEPNFSFEVELTVMVSWKDARIFKRCDNAGINGYEEGDVCAMFWKPQLIWPNIILKDDVEAKLVPNIIDDMGFTTRVAENVSDANQVSPGLETSLGFQKFKVRGHFEADLHFQKFPFDMQELNITVMMPDLPLRKAQFVARADSTPAEVGSGDLPLWETKCVSATVDVTTESDKGHSFQDASDDPFSSYIQKLEDLEPSAVVQEKYCHVDLKASNTTDVSEKESIFAKYEQFSTITLTVQIQRKPEFYMYNFVLVVSLLVIVSFFSFHMDKAALGDRLGLTLTIVLGLNVFQIVIIDNMPATGYLTSMHCFLLYSTMIVMGVAMENLIVFSANKRRTRIESTVDTFMQLKKKKKKKKEDTKREFEMTGTVLGGDKGRGGDVENAFTHENPMRNPKKRGGKSPPQTKEDNTRESLASEDENVSSGVNCSCHYEQVLSWVDMHLDKACEVLFPMLFAYTFYVLMDKGEDGDEGVVQDRCVV